LSKNLKIEVFRTIILPVALYGSENWSLTLREGHALRVTVNRVLRRIFGPKRKEGTGDWRRLHNEERHNLYTSNIQVIKSRMMRRTGNVARMGEIRNADSILVGKPE
jgi:hypothetical protein